METPNITQEKLFELMSYNPDSGIFIWKHRENVGKEWNSRCAGKASGTLSSIGYVFLTINGKKYYAHRMAWLYVHGFFPIVDIDHINMNRSDNRICNLRLATKSENMWNTQKRVRNTSGYKGVGFNKLVGKWEAKIMRHRKRIFFGYHETPEQAAAAIAAGVRELDGVFARC